MRKLTKLADKLATENEGASVIEYALIIAVVAVIFAVALRDVTGSNFSGFIDRIATCLSNSTSCT